MFGHNSFSWVPFRAESMFLIKNSETHQGGVNTDDDCDGPNDDDCWSYEDDGWVADPCESKFFIQDQSTPVGCSSSAQDDYQTTSCTTDRATLWYEVPSNEATQVVHGIPMKSLIVDGMATDDGWMDSISRIFCIVGFSGWPSDPGGIDPPKLEDGKRAISTTFSKQNWTWFSNLTKPCETDGPQPIDCEFGAWGNWSSCTPDSGSIEGGGQTRTRPIITQPQHGGQACPTATSGYEVGDTEWRMCKVPVDCEWGAWSAWTEWTECFGGEKSRNRNRTATTYQQDGGQPCSKLDGSEGANETQTELGTCSCSEGYEFYTWGQGAQGKCIRTPCDDENREQDDEGGCETNCKEGYEYDSQNKCQEIPETPSTTITTQSDKTEVAVTEDGKKTNLTLLIGGIAVLGIGGLLLSQR